MLRLIAVMVPSQYWADSENNTDYILDHVENIISASAADLRKAGTDPRAIRLPGQDGQGGYMASLELVYHMHCLNFLRKASFVDHQYYKDDPVFQDPVYPVEYRISKRAMAYVNLSPQSPKLKQRLTFELR